MGDVPLWLKYTSASAGIVGVLLGVYTYFAPTVGSYLGIEQTAVALSADTTANAINIADILNRYDAEYTSLAKQNFLATYENSKVYGLGTFADIGKAGDGYLVTIKVAGHLVSCDFGNNSEIGKRLLILTKGQSIAFSGTFTGGVVWGGGWSVRDCTLGSFAD